MLARGEFPILRALVKSGILTAEEAEHCCELARTRGESLWQTLLSENKITETWLADWLSQRLHAPLAGVGPLVIDEEAAHRITESLARRHECIPVAVNGRHLEVAFVDPSNLSSVQAIEFFTGSKVRPLVGLRSRSWKLLKSNIPERRR